MKKLVAFLIVGLPLFCEAQILGGSRRIKPGVGVTEADPTVSAAAKAITSTDVSNWNAAYSWGNPASSYVGLTGDQTIGGNKTFSGSTQVGALTFTQNMIPSPSGSRTIGTTGATLLAVYSAQFLGAANMVVGTNATTASIIFRHGTSTSTGGFFANTGNFYAMNTGSTPTDNGAGVQFSHSRTASSGLARGMHLANTLTAAANNDVLVGLDIPTSFANGAFTGVANYAIRHNGTIVPANNGSFDLGVSSSRYRNVYTQSINASSSVELTTADTGIILKSPDGTRYLIKVQNGGSLTVVSAP